MPSDTVGTKVAPRNRNHDGNITSIIHIRRKQIIQMFKDYKEIEFEIFEDCIIVKPMDINENGQIIDSNSYSVSIEDVEALVDPKVDEQIRRAVAKHTKKHPILQKIYVFYCTRIIKHITTSFLTILYPTLNFQS